MQVVVTRPLGDAPGWVNGLAQAGLQPLVLPLIEVGPVANTAPILRAWQGAHHYRALMFVSGNAVSHFFALKPPVVPVFIGVSAIKTRVWATGPGTVRALMAAGVPPALIDAPDHDSGQFDSEALWAVVGSRVAAGERVLIVRGGDAQPDVTPATGPCHAQNSGVGRDWLAAQLTALGVGVDYLVAYQRRAPGLTQAQMALACAAATDGSIWLFSSSEAIANLQATLPQQTWEKARAVATHSRIAAKAKMAGFGVVCESRPTLASVVASIESLA